ncbi:TPA: helix-turn-helix transcriptional regulator [Streptococcus suis]|uniref:helix-turn-helix domain-containing protein n=1 Tax=Streptococcus suis TaxID=1307 RepID=UPI000942005A|nr:helix-turn-helix transcriptional regulator [Streptococcus suis]WNF58979.1 helix-turn-helix transcriptional regulator [Streptococcus suis]HEL1699432.1 helix-turn-helix transcriptional regulator [Streptococcus suis]HEL1705015.1 helix-turn-helix transcriptional regulator [Streptococcus suis]HEL1764735.1 helix-turn-helix transcriptional regulator [Streptococcus suis]HEL1793074.1 helix-turn-helix transcriptional regulator [Streptococcus suis]
MNKLKSIRKKAGISQAKLSKKTNIPLRTIQHWELGNTIKPEKAKILADFFGVTVTYLLGYSDFEDEFDAYIALSDKNQDDDFVYIKSLILKLISKKSLEKIEREYSNSINNFTQESKYTSFLKALDNLRDSDEGKLLIWFSTLDKDDKAMLLSLAESLSNKTNQE